MNARELAEGMAKLINANASVDSDIRAIARIAELRNAGEPARARIVWMGGSFRVTVRRGDGSIDPER